MTLILKWKTKGLIDGESKGGDCDSDAQKQVNQEESEQNEVDRDGMKKGAYFWLSIIAHLSVVAFLMLVWKNDNFRHKTRILQNQKVLVCSKFKLIKNDTTLLCQITITLFGFTRRLMLYRWEWVNSDEDIGEKSSIGLNFN